jgi:hypothetical protein
VRASGWTMANSITPDEVLGVAPTTISAQDVIDAVPVDRQLQPQLRSGQTPISPIDVDAANSPAQIPKNINVVQQPTGRDMNVQPGSSGFATNFKAGLVEDPRTKIAIHAKRLFPNDPTAASRFGIRDGRIVYIDDDMNVKDAEAGAAAGFGNALAYSPETTGAIIGSFAARSPVLGAAIGSIGGKAAKQIIAGTALNDPQTTLGNVKGMATEGAVNLAAGGLSKLVGRFLNKGRVVDFTPAKAGEAATTRDATQASTGITLDLAQASQDPALMSLRKYAAKFPGESAQIFKQLDELQTTQSAEAMQKLIATVSTAMSSDAAGRQGINAANEAIKAARAGVSKQVKPLYDAAYASVPEVSAADKQGAKVLEFLKLPYFREAFAAGQKLRSLETGSATKPAERVTERLHKADPQAGTFETATTTVDSTSTGAKVIR